MPEVQEKLLLAFQTIEKPLISQIVFSDKLALEKLRGFLIDGWRPDWSGCLKKFPKNWDIVASKMIDISLNANKSEISGCKE